MPQIFIVLLCTLVSIILKKLKTVLIQKDILCLHQIYK